MLNIELPLITESMKQECIGGELLAGMLCSTNLEVLHNAKLQMFHEPYSQTAQRPENNADNRLATVAGSTNTGAAQSSNSGQIPSATIDCLKTVRIVAHEAIGEEIDISAPLMSAGLDSLLVAEFVSTLSTRAGIEVPPTALFDHPTLESLAGFISDELTSNDLTEPSPFEEERSVAAQMPILKMRE